MDLIFNAEENGELFVPPAPGGELENWLVLLVLGIPLAGFLLTGLLGRRMERPWLISVSFILVATAIAIQTFYAGVKRVGGARASLISTVEPVYTVVLAMILFGERLTPVQVVGGALVIFAVILAETGRPDTVEATDPEPA